MSTSLSRMNVFVSLDSPHPQNTIYTLYIHSHYFVQKSILLSAVSIVSSTVCCFCHVTWGRRRLSPKTDDRAFLYFLISIHFLHLSLSGSWGVEPIQAAAGREAGYTPDRLPVHRGLAYFLMIKHFCS